MAKTFEDIVNKLDEILDVKNDVPWPTDKKITCSRSKRKMLIEVVRHAIAEAFEAVNEKVGSPTLDDALENPSQFTDGCERTIENFAAAQKAFLEGK